MGFTQAIFPENELDVPILLPGDLWHTPAHLATKTFYIYSEFFNKVRKEFPSAKFIGIPGNHDQSEFSNIGIPVPNLFTAWCNCFPELFVDASYQIIHEGSMAISGIPYVNHNIGYGEYIKGKLRKKISIDPSMFRVLLIHTDLMGAVDPSGREVGQVENIPRNLTKFFKDWDFVLAGHIHKPQLMYGDNIVMLGSPYQQRRSDAKCSMGYWIMYDDKTVKFKEYKAPEFKFYHEGEGHKDTDDFWTAIPKKVKLEKKKTKKFNPKMNRTKMAKKYVRAKGIEGEAKLTALIEILNKIEE